VEDEKRDVEKIDVSKLPERRFPAGRFRVNISPDAYRTVHDHATTDPEVELCGVLVGEVLKDGDGPYLAIAGAIRGEHAASQAGQVTFTHETWNHIHRVRDAEFPNAKIVGWYHTHPRFGVFLSPQDEFIHGSFFTENWQVAFVLDPIAKDEGFLVWRDGKPHLLDEFWIGPRHRIRAEDVASLRREVEESLSQRRPVPRFRFWLTLAVSAIVTGLAAFLLVAGLQGRFRGLDRRLAELTAPPRPLPLDSLQHLLDADSSLAGADLRLSQDGPRLVCQGQVYTKYQSRRVVELLSRISGIRGILAPSTVRVPLYQVKPGDCLESISQRLYGDPDKWEYIMYQNGERIVNPDSIEPGWMLIVPEEVP
jgi:proteasome lid subunit RPN8/RPN11